MKTKIKVLILMGLLISITTFALWQTPITQYTPKNDVERALTRLFSQYITSRNLREVDAFLATLHPDCRYMVTKDLIVTKDELRGMLPDLWAQNDDGNAAFGHCMAWECWHENYYKNGMLVNPKFRIEENQAKVDFKFVSGLFMDDNYFKLTQENGAWLIVNFARPIY